MAEILMAPAKVPAKFSICDEPDAPATARRPGRRFAALLASLREARRPWGMPSAPPAHPRATSAAAW